MIPRDAESTIRDLLQVFPVLTITGPRQSGKTTLTKLVFAGRPYVSLEDPDIRVAAQDDPRGFLARYPDGGVLDEVQRCPDLFSYLQTRVDADGRMGLFILTGSQQFGLMSGITQSLAGRTAFLDLLPFSATELGRAAKLPATPDEMLLSGGYPPLHDRRILPRNWFPAYVNAYLERDVRQLLKIHELETFHRFVRLCAGRTGQLLNLSSLAAECGITHNTARSWISVLEASYIVFLLRPHHANFSKRLVKTPKLYFYDCGLAAWLLGIRTSLQMQTHPLRGALFETYAVSEIAKRIHNRGEKPPLYFWRDSNGNEVDLIIDEGARLVPVEIKSGTTLARDAGAGIEKWLSLAGKIAAAPALVYGGLGNYEQKGMRILGWTSAGDAADSI
ncbi:MAG TPA: ATP-binding protein [Candidatus Deferrimicrobiaceae bacterium]|jgi:hypothetical protein